MTQILILPNKDLKNNYYRYVNKLREKYIRQVNRWQIPKEKEKLLTRTK